MPARRGRDGHGFLKPPSTPRSEAAQALATRALTALVLIALFVLAVLLMPTALLALLLGTVAALAALEWASLCGLAGRGRRIAFAALTLAAGLALLAASWASAWFLLPGVAWWLWAAWELRTWRDRAASPGAARCLARGVAAIAPAWSALVYVHALPAVGPASVLCLFAVVWAADTGGFFAGRRWGRRRLAPALSPGKTVAGSVGGMAAVAAFALLSGILWPGAAKLTLWSWIALCLVVGVFSVVGDLTESALKRLAHVKDSGSLLPGHGGVLDRTDSILAAAPAFALGWTLLLRIGTTGAA